MTNRGARGLAQRGRGLLLSLRTAEQDLERLRVTAGYAAIHASRARYDRARDLGDVEVSVFSARGEDGILDFLLDRLTIRHPRCLELGVGDYSEANTRFLVETRGASVLLVDANERLQERLRLHRIGWRGNVAARTAFVTRENVRDLLAYDEIGGPPEVVSIDLDGMDYWILEQVPLEGCSVVVCEYNALLGDDPVAVPYDPAFERFASHPSGHYYGASLSAMAHQLRSRGFSLVGVTTACVNAFFVRHDLLDRLPFPAPEPAEWSGMTRRLLRDTRTATGGMVSLPPDRQRALLTGLAIVDVTTGEARSL